VLLGSSAAAADLSTRIFVESPVLAVPKLNDEMSDPIGPLTDSYHFSDILPPFFGELDAYAEVGYGVIRVRASAQINTGSYDISMVSMDSGVSADGTFSDMVTISAPGLAGLSGTFVPVIKVSGRLSASGSGSEPPFASFSEASWVLDFVPGFEQRSALCSGYDGAGPVCDFQGDKFGTYTLKPVAFTYGRSFVMTVKMSAGTFSRTVPNGSTDVENDLSFTTTWKGFGGVFDDQGAPVSNFSVTSNTGTDWSQPVPEPSATACATAALVMLGVLRKRTRRSPAS
jgi:hypothetical protein